MLTNVEIIKGDVGHNIMGCLLGWVINRLAQIVETLPKLARAFVGMDCQIQFKKLVNCQSDYSVAPIYW